MPRIYVGTYGKYNRGSIAGAWLDLDELSDKETFLQACAELHKDESDPEFMYQDYEGFPSCLYSEGHLKPALFEYLALDPADREIVDAYSHVNDDTDFSTAQDAYMGCADSKEAWAEQWLEDSGDMSSIPEHLRSYFDIAAWLRDQEASGMNFVWLNNQYYVFNA